MDLDKGSFDKKDQIHEIMEAIGPALVQATIEANRKKFK